MAFIVGIFSPAEICGFPTIRVSMATHGNKLGMINWGLVGRMGGVTIGQCWVCDHQVGKTGGHFPAGGALCVVAANQFLPGWLGYGAVESSPITNQ